jgi:hypothetical protein
MKTESRCCDKARCVAYTVGILGSLLVVAWLVSLMNAKTNPGAIGADRAAERRKNLVEMQAANQDTLTSYAWENQGKGFVRLPVERAMEISLKEWKNPAEARANLLSRIDKLTAAAPKAPEKPSQFE